MKMRCLSAAQNRYTEIIIGSRLVGRFGRRLAARLIDVSLGSLFFVFFLSAAEFAIAPIGASEPLKGMLILPYAAMMLLLVYEPLAIALTGCTVGKRIMGIGIRSYGNIGRVPTLSQSVVRWAVPTISGVTLAVLALAAVRWMLPRHDGEAAAMLEFVMRGSLEMSDYFGLWLLSNAAFFGAIVGTPLGSAVLAAVKPPRDGEQRGWHDRLAGTTVMQSRTDGGSQPAVTLPPTAPLSARWKRFRDELRTGALRQYEADAEMRARGASVDGPSPPPERRQSDCDVGGDESPAGSP